MTLLMHESKRVQPQPRHKLNAKTLSEIGTSLAEIDWRLLHWLLRYPLQRADDLVLGIAHWASRATVYRHVQALEASGLLESVLPKTPGTGKRLYHLSNPGLHLLAIYLGIPARELARRWQADETGLMRLLPRLPTLLVLQDVINGLVTHAADAMTTQGRRPELVRWSRQRDVVHHFHYREQRMRFFADGVVALCIHTQQGESSVQEQWYGVFLLSTELNDERLMRFRLEHLMCWRESPEHWSCYQHMLPVLILARTPRQREHWQRAIETTAVKLRLDPLAGATACLIAENISPINPWLFNWRTLATEVPCHLQEILKPLPPAAFPSSLRLEESDEVKHTAQPKSNGAARLVDSAVSNRLCRLIAGDLTRRVAQVTRDGLDEPEVVSLLALRLTNCQWRILHLLLVHPLLSDEELAALLALERKSARCSLYQLHRLDCIESVGPSAGKRWQLCERGLRLIAAANHLPIRTFAVTPDGEADKDVFTWKQRGISWLGEHIQHTAGIYGFFARLAQTVRTEAGHELCWWETGAMCERRYQVGEQWYNLRPDALAEYRMGSQHIRFWLEWDRGTMNVRDLAVKFTSYRHYIASRQWARESLSLPTLCCIAPDIAQERRMQRVAQARLTQTPGLVLRTTTEVLLREQGLLAAIWLQSMPRHRQASQPERSHRQCLFDVLLG